MWRWPILWYKHLTLCLSSSFTASRELTGLDINGTHFLYTTEYNYVDLGKALTFIQLPFVLDGIWIYALFCIIFMIKQKTFCMCVSIDIRVGLHCFSISFLAVDDNGLWVIYGTQDSNHTIVTKVSNLYIVVHFQCCFVR